LIDRLHPARFDDDLEMCMRQYLQTRDGEEAQEGIRLFGKRQPEWNRISAHFSKSGGEAAEAVCHQGA
jgi:hypothetical protein